MEENFLMPNKIRHAFPFNPTIPLLVIPNGKDKRCKTLFIATLFVMQNTNNQNAHQKGDWLLRHKASTQWSTIQQLKGIRKSSHSMNSRIYNPT